MTINPPYTDIVTYDPRDDGHTFESYHALWEKDRKAAWKLHGELQEKMFQTKLSDGRTTRQYLDELIGDSGGVTIMNGHIVSQYPLSREPTSDETGRMAKDANAIVFSYGRVQMEMANYLDDIGAFPR